MKKSLNIIIREEEVADYQATEEVIQHAFKDMEMSDQTEHNLVRGVRRTNAFIPALSLVAVDEETNKLVGHILLSKITIIGDGQSTDSLALAPISVLPKWQHKGVGKALMDKALANAKELGYNSVIVLGHPQYYTKFGFKKASTWDITAPFEVPEETFMALPLEENALRNVSGVVEYSKAFME